MRQQHWLIAGWGAVAVALAACSGQAIVDGAGGTTTSAGGTTASSSASGAGAAGSCSSHDQCPGGLCLFSTGQCSTSCPEAEPCPVGEICDGCATSSCPQCYDCLAACVPAEPGQCDYHDDCPEPQLCLYAEQQCAPACTGNDCAAGQICDPCATSSCYGCKDCVPACVPL